MNRNRFFPLVLILVLFGLAACQTQKIPLPDPDEVELDPEVMDLNEGNNGSAILDIKHGIESPAWGQVMVLDSFTILIERDKDEPRGSSMIFNEVEGLVEVSITAPTYDGSQTSTMQVPVTFTVEGSFYPYPRCEFELQITEYIAFSEVTSMENTVLGTIPIPDGAGEDIVTFVPKFTLKAPDYFYNMGGTEVLTVSIGTVVLDGDSGCMFSD